MPSNASTKTMLAAGFLATVLVATMPADARERGSGMATGRRTYEPVTTMKAVPKKVKVEKQEYMKIEMKDAYISSYKSSGGDAAKVPKADVGRGLRAR